MRRANNHISLLMIAACLAAVALAAAISFHGIALAADEVETAVFGVTWYDVGKAALEGLDGVKKVTRGWHGGMEINTVWYDATVISVEEMKDALIRAGTYIKTVEDWRGWGNWKPCSERSRHSWWR